MAVNATMWIQLRVRLAAVPYPASRELASASPASMPKTIFGGCICAAMVRVVATSATINDRPSAFRYPRGEGTGVALPTQAEILALGKGRVLREGTNIAILSLGTRLADAEALNFSMMEVFIFALIGLAVPMRCLALGPLTPWHAIYPELCSTVC